MEGPYIQGRAVTGFGGFGKHAQLLALVAGQAHFYKQPVDFQTELGNQLNQLTSLPKQRFLLS